MNIGLSVRPSGLKKGVSTKKWCQALGFPQEVGLSKTCGQIELNAQGPQDCAFLLAVSNALSGKGRIVIYDEDGKEVAQWKEPLIAEEGTNPNE